MSLTTVLEATRELRAVLALRPHFVLREWPVPDPVTGERVLLVSDAPVSQGREATATLAVRWVGNWHGYIQVKLLAEREFASRIWRRTPPPYNEIALVIDERFAMARATAERRAALDEAEDADRKRLEVLLPQLGPKSVQIGRSVPGQLVVDVILRPKAAADLDVMWNLLSLDERFRASPTIWLRIAGVTVPRLEELLTAGQGHLRPPIERRFAPKRKRRRGATRAGA